MLVCIANTVHLLGFTRTVSAIYCVSMVIVFLRVQLNVIGGYMFVDSAQNKDGLVSLSSSHIAATAAQ